ncbi:gamma-glutamylcyclotransferase family protein [Actinomadura kijaniata]|uniref:gamma-glutamylcyclotransferase family protein n=1 Tax=Actinomadura kijaniata TaxID=46161 RepID=UPI003F1DE89B
MSEVAGLFVYGTLRYPEVLRALLGRVPDLSPASAKGWRVRALPGVVYPGLVPDPASTAEGLLMTGLTDAERHLIDIYEGDLYDTVTLTLEDGRRAHAYTWRGETEAFDWDPRHFASHELAAYLAALRP